jgi:hypothetical protein
MVVRDEEDALSVRAMAAGRDLTLDLLRVWRRDLDALDALIMLAIVTANVDGILFDPEMRARYGGSYPIAPNRLRHPIADSVIALTLGLPLQLVRRRAAALVAAGRCGATAEGLLITQAQVEASNRVVVNVAIYELLRRSYARFKAEGLFALVPLLAPGAAGGRPLRSAPAYAGKYMLRTFDALSAHVCDVRDAWIVLELMPLAGPRPLPVPELADRIGLSRGMTARRVEELIECGLCRWEGEQVAIPQQALADDWCRQAQRRNLDNLFQLFAALAEVGALAEFEARPQAQQSAYVH